MPYRQKNGQELFHNARVTMFPDGSREILVCRDKSIFKAPGWEESDKWDNRKPSLNPSEAQLSFPLDNELLPETAEVNGGEANQLRAMRRAKARVHALALANDFKWFVTLTLSQTEVDRYDMGAITRKLNNWCDNHVRRDGLAYILVPERHKDGAIHFHGFFNGALSAVPSGHKDKHGHEVYNLPAWTLGFTTAIALYGSYRSAVGYVCKYIGKQGEKPGGRWYYSGGKLREPESVLVDMLWTDVPDDAYTFGVGSGWMMAKWTEGGGCDEVFRGIEEAAP